MKKFTKILTITLSVLVVISSLVLLTLITWVKIDPIMLNKIIDTIIIVSIMTLLSFIVNSIVE